MQRQQIQQEQRVNINVGSTEAISIMEVKKCYAKKTGHKEEAYHKKILVRGEKVCK